MEEVKELITEWPITQEHSNIHISTNKSPIDNINSVETIKRQHEGNIKKDIENLAKVTKSVDMVNADVALARWWRREGRRFISPAKLPKSTNPKTILNFVQRTDIAKEFFRRELKKLECQAGGKTWLSDTKKEDGQLYTAMASYHEKLGDLEKAQDSIKQALLCAPDANDALWVQAKIERQLKIKSIQESHHASLQKSNETRVFPAYKSVERRSCKSLSCREFYNKYSKTSTPVIITDYLPSLTATPWTFDHIKEKAGKMRVTLKRSVHESVEWARLEDSTTTTVAEFIEKLHTEMAEGMNLFDWSLPLNCPQLAEELTIPRYFAGDFLQRTSPGSLYQDSWPSLFIAPEGSTTQLHVDAFGSNFWMALFQGKKRWVFFPEEDEALLYPQYLHSMDPVFEADLETPDLLKQPLLSLTHPLECILQPGELLFVPAGCPHRVENLDISLAISGNFVDLSNLQLVKEELTINALSDPRANDLLHQFRSASFNSDMDFDISDLPWNELKKKYTS